MKVQLIGEKTCSLNYKNRKRNLLAWSNKFQMRIKRTLNLAKS